MARNASLHIVVAGGAGMIGSHLCEELVMDGHHVTCLDNLCTGRFINLEPIRNHSRFRFILHDVIEPLPSVGHVVRVYHLASPASPHGYTRLPLETMRVNSEGTRRLIELAYAHNGRFLFCSTSEVYGDPQQHPQAEDYRGNVNPIGPRSTYDEAKRFGEAMTMAYVRKQGLDGRIVRIFNTYGPRSDPHDGRLVANFALQALRGEPLTLYGDGTQTRSLCYVTDLVGGLRSVMECDRARGEVMNLGNPEERTVREFAEIILKLTGSKSPKVFTEPAVGDDPRMRRPNIDKVRALVGWQPHVALTDGLTATIAGLRAALSQAAAAEVSPLGNGQVMDAGLVERRLVNRRLAERRLDDRRQAERRFAERRANRRARKLESSRERIH